MTREEIQEVLADDDTDYVWLGYSPFSDKRLNFICAKVEEFDRDTGDLTYDQDSHMNLNKISFARPMDREVWEGLRSRQQGDFTGFTLKGTMMSESGEITVKGRITRVDQTLGTVHFESDFMLSDIAELTPHFKDEDTTDVPV